MFSAILVWKVFVLMKEIESLGGGKGAAVECFYGYKPSMSDWADVPFLGMTIYEAISGV